MDAKIEVTSLPYSLRHLKTAWDAIRDMFEKRLKLDVVSSELAGGFGELTFAFPLEDRRMVDQLISAYIDLQFHGDQNNDEKLFLLITIGSKTYTVTDVRIETWCPTAGYVRASGYVFHGKHGTQDLTKWVKAFSSASEKYMAHYARPKAESRDEWLILLMATTSDESLNTPMGYSFKDYFETNFRAVVPSALPINDDGKLATPMTFSIITHTAQADEREAELLGRYTQFFGISKNVDTMFLVLLNPKTGQVIRIRDALLEERMVRDSKHLVILGDPNVEPPESKDMSAIISKILADRKDKAYPTPSFIARD